jgi:soluble lytic murein transglycosylase
MDELLLETDFKIVALVSLMALGPVPSVHSSQDIRLFTNTKGNFIFGKLEQALPSTQKKYAETITRAVLRESAAHAMDPLFVFALVQQESGFSISKIGEVGEVGLMQVRPETAQWVSKKYGIPYDGSALFDPAVNIKFGTAYLGYLKSRYESKDHLFVPAYNMGIRGLHKALLRGNTPVDYLEGVRSKYSRLKKEFRHHAIANAV